MGCDGGTIPRRDELVRVKKKPEQVDKNAENAAKWKHCAISQQPLRSPIVSCELGKLYNKEAVIECLLSKNDVSDVSKHISKLSDIKELKLSVNNGYEKKGADKGGEYVDVHASKFFCPVTGIEMNGKQNFCFFWKCGCVLSEKAIKEVKSDVCHKCGLPVTDDDVIIINGTDDDTKILQGKMEARRQAAKLEKKRKKAKASVESVPSEKKQKIDMDKPSTSNVSVKIDPEVQTNGVKRSEKKINGVVSSKKPTEVTSKKLTLPPKAQPEYSISKDPSASAAYKSLFTSHVKAKSQTKAHWVTHNPLYY